jgi:hypothetical protein
LLEYLKERSWLISSGLVVSALFLWIFSCIQARGNITSDMSQLGLFSILPLSFFVAFFFLVVSFFVTIKFVDKNRVLLLVTQTFLLIFFLNLTPSIIEGTARFTTGYRNFQVVDYITITGHINTTQQWILNWPSFTIFMNVFEQLTSIPEQWVLLTYTTLFNILLFPVLFMFFRALSKDYRVVWVGIWFAFFGNWIGQDYFSMQSVAFLVAVLLLSLLFKNMNRGIHNRQWYLVFLLLFFYVVSSHLLTSIAIFCVVLVLFLARQISRPILPFSLLALIIGWAVFDANVYLSWNLASYLQQTFNFSAIFQKNLISRLSTGSASHVMAADVRVIFSAAMIGFALLGLLFSWRSKMFGKVEKRAFATVIGFALLTFAFVYGGELFLRLYMFSLIPLAYFAAQAIIKHKRILVIALVFFAVLAPMLNIIAQYGNETIDYVPYSETSGVNFLYNATTAGHIVGGGDAGGDFRNINYEPNYSSTTFLNLYQYNTSSLLWTSPRDIGEDRYVCVSYATNSYFSWYYGDPMFVPNIEGNLTQSTSYDLLYSNPSFVVYHSAPLP